MNMFLRPFNIYIVKGLAVELGVQLEAQPQQDGGQS